MESRVDKFKYNQDSYHNNESTAKINIQSSRYVIKILKKSTYI